MRLASGGLRGLINYKQQMGGGELKITRKGEVPYQSGPYVAKESGIRLKVRGNGS